MANPYASRAYRQSRPARAIIDIGSNTVRLVVYGGPPRAPTVVLNEKVTARLGRDLATDRLIPEPAAKAALDALARFALLLAELEVGDVEVVATAAAREASNGREFLAQVRALALEPRLLSGQEEAETSAFGVLGAFPGAAGIVADLGGGSLELVEIDGHTPTHGVSLPLGTLQLPALRREGPAKFRRKLEKLLEASAYSAERGRPLYLVGGSLRAFGHYAMAVERSPLEDAHGYCVEPDSARRICTMLSQRQGVAPGEVRGISSARAAMLPDAAALLEVLLDKLAPSEIVCSSWGLREGLLFRRLSPAARGLDPLLAGVAAFTSGRPGSLRSATMIAGWTAVGNGHGGRGRERIRLAAILLALASRDLEPNLRRRHSRDWALHKRWVGITAAERAILAAALLANCGATRPDDDLRKLASEDDLREGMIWGLGFRLCRRLAAGSVRSLIESELRLDAGVLVLALSEALMPLFGESTEKDLRNLAGAIGCEWRMERLASWTPGLGYAPA